MAGLIDDFIILLKEQAGDFSDLAALAQEKKEAIINNDLEHLQKITNIENILVGKNLKTERRRVQLLKDIAIVLNAPAASLTLSKLAELLKNKPGCEELRQVSADLRKAADELKSLNEQNKVLIDNSLEYIEFSMNLVRGSVTGPSFYGKDDEAGTAFFDARQ